MYNRNPLAIVGAGRRRRQAVGAEFVQCPNGEWVKGPTANANTCAGKGWPSGGGTTGTPPYNRTPYTPPTPTPPYTPPYTPPSIPTPPYTPPYTPPVDTPPPSIPENPPIRIPTPGGCAPAIQVCPENQKRYVMPFIPDAGYTASVTAGSQVRFVGKPQKLFKPDRLIIASTIAPYFDIVNLIIGNIPQSLSQGNVAADMFSEVATYVMMSFDQAYPGIDVIIVAQNKSSVTQTFQAQLVGEAVG